PLCVNEVGGDATVAAFANVANHAVDADLINVTLAKLALLCFHISIKLFHVAFSGLIYRCPLARAGISQSRELRGTTRLRFECRIMTRQAISLAIVNSCFEPR